MVTTMKFFTRCLAALPFPVLLTACPGPAQEGWAPSLHAGGPQVIYDLTAEPLPEIPLPNDTATRLDPSSPTGRRLNFSTAGSTQHERATREHQ